MLWFLETDGLRFTLLSYYRRINLNFLNKPFFYITKKDNDLNILRMKRAFKIKQNASFIIIFKETSFKQIKLTLLEVESLTLISSHNFVLKLLKWFPCFELQGSSIIALYLPCRYFTTKDILLIFYFFTPMLFTLMKTAKYIFNFFRRIQD